MTPDRYAFDNKFYFGHFQRTVAGAACQQTLDTPPQALKKLGTGVDDIMEGDNRQLIIGYIWLGFGCCRHNTEKKLIQKTLSGREALGKFRQIQRLLSLCKGAKEETEEKRLTGHFVGSLLIE